MVKSGEVNRRIIDSPGLRTWGVLGVVAIPSCILAWCWSPYDVAISLDLLILASTVFSVFLVVYIFLRNTLRLHLEFLEEEIGQIAREWNNRRYKLAKKAAQAYETDYRVPFFFILAGKSLLFVSMLLSMFTVFVYGCRWVEMIALGFIISALIMFIIMLWVYLD